jgi:hypothetical protein
MYGYKNDDGEPIMDAAAYRYEQYLDSMYDPDPDDSWEGSGWGDEQPEPEDCDHSDRSWTPTEPGFKCDICWSHFEGPNQDWN